MGSRRVERPRACRHAYSDSRLREEARQFGILVSKTSQHQNTWCLWSSASVGIRDPRIAFLWVQPLSCGHPAVTPSRVGPHPKHSGGLPEPGRAELHRGWTRVGVGARRAEVLHTGTVAECLAEARRLFLAWDAAERLGGNAAVQPAEGVR